MIGAYRIYTRHVQLSQPLIHLYAHHVHIDTHTYTRIHAHTHACTYTRTHALERWGPFVSRPLPPHILIPPDPKPTEIEIPDEHTLFPHTLPPHLHRPLPLVTPDEKLEPDLTLRRQDFE
jgi:hypothetical protein